MANENAIRNLIRIEDKANPTLFRALQLMIDDLYKINEEVFPSKPIRGIDQGGIALPLGPVQNFTGTAYPDNLRLDWDDLSGAFRYHIKMGSDWDTARHILLTATDMANVDPVFLHLVYGTYNFIIRAMNIDGELGDSAAATLIIPVIPAPDLNLEVVVANVLLRWTVPPSAWRIDYYNVYKDNILIGSISGTFKLIQEQAGGTYAYSVEAVDIVGNISTRSPAKIADLHDPSEFEFVDELSADYTGTYVNTVHTIIDGIEGVLGPIPVLTWQDHFLTFGYNSPQDQVDAGYPVYYQPTHLGTGSYEEVFDFGQVYENITIVVDYNKQQVNGTTEVTIELAYSEDGITYSTTTFGSSVYAIKFRYVKVKWVMTNFDNHHAAFLTNLRVVLNVTLTLDSGSLDCFKTDVGGTLVTYNKTFTGISSVTAITSTSLQPLYIVCDAVNKDNFRALVFDSSGNRANANIDWKARGVV
jgi:hypothetical protein